MDNQKQRKIKRRAVTSSRSRHIDGVFKDRNHYSGSQSIVRQGTAKREPHQSQQSSKQPPAPKQHKKSGSIQPIREAGTPQARLQRAQEKQRNLSIKRFHYQKSQAQADHKNLLYPELAHHLESSQQQSSTHKNTATQRTNQTTQKTRFWLWRWLAKLYISIPIGLVILCSLGWLLYLQVPYLSLQVVRWRADFTVGLAQAPDGFRVNEPLVYDNQQVFTKLVRGDELIDLSQQASSLDSSSLIAQLEQPTIEYQSQTLAGRTILIHRDNNQATWVNKGVLYTLSANFEMNQQQVFEIAQSL